jgi:hypothetical protein
VSLSRRRFAGGRLAASCLFAVAAAGVSAQSAGPLSLATVLERAGAYLADYEPRLMGIVAEETYEQHTEKLALSGLDGAARGGRRRVLKSDYLLVKTAAEGWLPFRDVFEVDGRPVRDRADRLVELFIKPDESGFTRAQRIMAESARYNLGRVRRTINTPVLAILFVEPGVAGRFQFDHRGDEPLDGRQVWRIGFQEISRPTLVRTSGRRDLPMMGQLWIAPEDGAILKTMIRAVGAEVSADVSVSFIREATLGILVPGRMDERYSSTRDPDVTIGVATYSRFRRFQVTTGEEMRKPAEEAAQPIRKPPVR